MSKGNGKESKVEFDNNYFKIYADYMRLKSNNFGVKNEMLEKHSDDIRTSSEEILKVIYNIGTYIRIANSIYPVYQSELEERRLAQEKARGLCFDLLTKYQLIMYVFQIPDDKYTNEIKNIIHEINCLKKWRNSDTKRFKNLS